jgi:hypothetical protein
MKGVAPTLKLTFLTTLGSLALLGAGLVPGVALDSQIATAQGADEDDLLDGDLLDDDLLDDDVDAGKDAKKDAVAVPPAEVKRELDGKIAALAARSEAIGDELFVELANTSNANAEIERRIEEAEERYRNLSAQIAKLSSRPSGPRVQGPRGYGTPLVIGAGHSPMADLRNRAYDPLQPVGRGPMDPNGGHQLKWWEKLLLQLAEGVTELLKVLAEKRTNSLKAEADSIALGTDAKYRPYVDSEVRKAVGTSALGSRLKKTGSSNRLNDLLPRGGSAKPTGRPRTKTPAKPKVKTYTGSNRFNRGPMPESYLLPLKRDALTGEVRPMVALPLGAAPKR